MQSHAAPNKNSRWIRGVPHKHDPHVYGASGQLTSSNQWKFAGPVQTAWVPYEKLQTVLNNRRLVVDVATFAHARCEFVRLSLANHEEVPTNAVIPSRSYPEPFQRPTWITRSRTQPKPNLNKTDLNLKHSLLPVEVQADFIRWNISIAPPTFLSIPC